MEDFCHSVFGFLGNVFAAALFLSPAKTFYRVIRRRSTEEFSGLPYVAALLNCLLYAWYSSPAVTSNNILLMVSNAIGGTLEISYIVIYLLYSPPKYRGNIMWLLCAAVSLFLVVFGASLMLDNPQKTLLVGIVGASFSICMYGSPLSIMTLVIETRSVEYMPFLLSLFVFLCSVSRFTYAWLGDDIFVMTPNGVGVVLGTMQLALYAIYFRSSPNHPSQEPSQRLLSKA